MDDFKKEIFAFFIKWYFWIISIIIGLIAKLSYEMSQKRKMTVVQVFGITGISIFFGYICSVTCVSYGWVKQGQIAVPVCTLLGEKIAAYTISNFNKIVDIGTSFVQFLKNKK